MGKLILNKMVYQRILDHLIKHSLAFVFTEEGLIIDRKTCEEKIKEMKK